MTRGTRRAHRGLSVVAALVALAAIGVSVADALNVTGPTVTVAPTVSGQVATYTFSNFRTGGQESASAFRVTFPAGTTFQQPLTVDPPGTATVTGTTVNVDFSPHVSRITSFDVTIGGVINPPAANYPGMAFRMTAYQNNNLRDASVSGTTGPFTIESASVDYLSLSVDPTALNFGDVVPGTTSPSQYVNVTVSSSRSYTIHRQLVDPAGLGLAISGSAVGPKLPGQNSIFMDECVLTPPWETEPGSYNASVLYTVIPD